MGPVKESEEPRQVEKMFQTELLNLERPCKSVGIRKVSQ